MATLVDDLGEWEQLGGLAFDGSNFQWQYVNLSSSPGTFRINWITDWNKWWGDEGYRSFLYLQFRYSTGDSSVSYRAFPKEGKTLLEYPFAGKGYYRNPQGVAYTPSREIWVRQWVGYRRQKPTTETVLPFSFYLEGLLPLP